MTPPVFGYPQPGKQKSERLLLSFVSGADGHIRRDAQLMPGAAAAFYGTLAIEDLFRRARERAMRGTGDWFYMDNAYFDGARQRYFRISRNALQASRRRPDFARLSALGVKVQPWRAGGRHVLVVAQSDYFMRELAGWAGPRGASSWSADVAARIKGFTDRPIRIRAWQRDKGAAARTLAQDLEGAWALVTHASAAANEALLAGVPVFCSGDCVAAELGNRDLAQLEDPRRPDGRVEWAARLAASQWTLDEMRAGVAWRDLQSEEGKQ